MVTLKRTGPFRLHHSEPQSFSPHSEKVHENHITTGFCKAAATAIVLHTVRLVTPRAHVFVQKQNIILSIRSILQTRDGGKKKLQFSLSYLEKNALMVAGVDLNITEHEAITDRDGKRNSQLPQLLRVNGNSLNAHKRKSFYPKLKLEILLFVCSSSLSSDRHI